MDKNVSGFPLKLSIIVPARNEGGNIREILDGVRPFADELIVVDGNSSDNTVEIAKSYGARILTDNGKGKGAALRLAGAEAKGEVILFIDADGSHNPEDIPALVKPIMDGNADHVTGSRMLGGSDELFSSLTEFVRLVGSEIITLTVGKRFGIRLTDSQNGFRCLRKAVFDELDLKENITTIEQEMVASTLRRGYRLVEVPAHEYRRRHGQSSIKVWKVGFRYVYCLIKNVLKPIIRKLPPNMPEIQEMYRVNWGNSGNASHATIAPSTGPQTDFQSKTDSYWKEKLSPEQFEVCRRAGTERPFTGEYVELKEDGYYHCICCDAKLFDSETKFDSGTGWPSFWNTLDPNPIQYREDKSLVRSRTEVLCKNCGAHLGHVFDDGPAPTQKRYCINSVSLKFNAQSKK